MQLERLRELAVGLVVKLPLAGLRRAMQMPESGRLARDASRVALVEQLAQQIVSYRSMMNVSGNVFILIGVQEVASRFRESPRVARQALLLLQARGTAKSTHLKDRWALRG